MALEWWQVENSKKKSRFAPHIPPHMLHSYRLSGLHQAVCPVSGCMTCRKDVQLIHGKSNSHNEVVSTAIHGNNSSFAYPAYLLHFQFQVNCIFNTQVALHKVSHYLSEAMHSNIISNGQTSEENWCLQHHNSDTIALTSKLKHSLRAQQPKNTKRQCKFWRGKMSTGKILRFSWDSNQVFFKCWSDALNTEPLDQQQKIRSMSANSNTPAD